MSSWRLRTIARRCRSGAVVLGRRAAAGQTAATGRQQGQPAQTAPASENSRCIVASAATASRRKTSADYRVSRTLSKPERRRPGRQCRRAAGRRVESRARATRRRRRCTASGSTRRWSRWRPSSRAATCSTLIDARPCAARRQVGRHARRASVRAGQRLRLELVPTDESRAFRPAAAWRWPCVFEDEHLLVLDKPAGLVVHPAPGNWSGTLLNGLLAHHAAAATLPRAGIVHRLDKDTSGLMVVGKTLPAVTALVRAIAAREVHRQLPGAGARRDAGGAVHASMRRSAATRVSRVRMAVVPAPAGEPARTDVGGWRRRRRRRRRQRAALHAAHRPHPPDPRAPGLARPSAGGRCAVRRPPALGMQRQALHATRAAPCRTRSTRRAAGLRCAAAGRLCRRPGRRSRG